MCLCEPLSQYLEPETIAAPCDTYGPSDDSLYSEICFKIQQDRSWLLLEPRPLSSLLLRYFHEHARRIKDLLDFENLLQDCLIEMNAAGNVIWDTHPMLCPSEPDFGF